MPSFAVALNSPIWYAGFVVFKLGGMAQLYFSSVQFAVSLMTS